MTAAPAEAQPDGTQQHPLIFAAMAGVLKDMAPVGKDGVNADQKYKFRSIEDVMVATKAALAKHQVFYLPTVLNRLTEHRTTSSNKAMNTVHLEIRYDFYAVDGSNVSAVVWGEGADTQDKSTSKAMSMAVKYMLIQALNIAADDMQDPDRSAEEAGSYRSAGEAFDHAAPASQHRNGQHNGQPRNGQQARPAGPPPLQPLADDDPWKDAIADIADSDQANVAWTQIAEHVHNGTMTEARGAHLQKHITAHMASVRNRSNGHDATNGNGHQPAPATQDAAADPVVSGDENPWADQPDMEPWAAEPAEEPARPPRIRQEDQGARKPASKATGSDDPAWLADFLQKVADTSDSDTLRDLRRGIGQAIIDGHITSERSRELAAAIQERTNALRAGVPA